MQKPHDSAHSAFMKPTFLPHSPASAHEPHAELESLHGGSCATEREEAPKAANNAKLTRIPGAYFLHTPVPKSTLFVEDERARHSAGQVYTGRGTSSRGLHARSGPPSQ